MSFADQQISTVGTEKAIFLKIRREKQTKKSKNRTSVIILLCEECMRVHSLRYLFNLMRICLFSSEQAERDQQYSPGFNTEEE